MTHHYPVTAHLKRVIRYKSDPCRESRIGLPRVFLTTFRSTLKEDFEGTLADVGNTLEEAKEFTDADRGRSHPLDQATQVPSDTSLGSEPSTGITQIPDSPSIAPARATAEESGAHNSRDCAY